MVQGFRVSGLYSFTVLGFRAQDLGSWAFCSFPTAISSKVHYHNDDDHWTFLYKGFVRSDKMALAVPLF